MPLLGFRPQGSVLTLLSRPEPGPSDLGGLGDSVDTEGRGTQCGLPMLSVTLPMCPSGGRTE